MRAPARRFWRRVAGAMLLGGALSVGGVGASGCGVTVEPDLQADVAEPHGRVVTADAALEILAVDDVPVEYPEFGPIRFRDVGFKANLAPGVHYLWVRYRPTTGRRDESRPRRRAAGPMKMIAIDVQANHQYELRGEMTGGDEWRLEIGRVTLIPPTDE